MGTEELLAVHKLSESLVATRSESSAYCSQTQFTISVIVPTRNEMGNIEPLLTRINQATKGSCYWFKYGSNLRLQTAS
jgi:hypothetical protein